MWVNNNATASRGVEHKEGTSRHVMIPSLPMIPRTDEYYDRYAVCYHYGKIIKISSLAQDEMEKHMKWLNKLYGNEKSR